MATISHLNSAPLVMDKEIEQYIQSLMNWSGHERFPPIRLENKRSLEKFIDELSNLFEFGRGRLLIGKDTYEYLLEGWESECIADDVRKERKNWEKEDERRISQKQDGTIFSHRVRMVCADERGRETRREATDHAGRGRMVTKG